MKDVQLVDRLEEKMGLITLGMTIAYKGGVNYQDAFGTTGIWESIIHRKLNNMRVVPSAFKIEHEKSQFAGGYVKNPQTGAHDRLCHLTELSVSKHYCAVEYVTRNFIERSFRPLTKWC